MPEPRTAAQWQDECERLAVRRDAEIADMHWLDTQLLQAMRSGSRQLADLLHRSIRMARVRVEASEANLDAARAARDAAITDPDSPLLPVIDDPRAPWGPRLL